MTVLSAQLKRHLGTVLGTSDIEVTSVGGGDINEAYRLVCDSGQPYFLKLHRSPPPDMFVAEADGLRRLAEGGLRLPEVIEHSDGPPGYLLLQWIESGSRSASSWEALGAGLAALHRCGDESFGLDRDNFIGRLPQANPATDSWLTFFRDHRLQAQISQLKRPGAGLLDRLERLLGQLDDWVPDQPDVSLLHGDLWGGNLMFDAAGSPVLIDPAVYCGHREIELAFTELFGGFDRRFYDAYNAAWPLDAEYATRRDLYNLYPLLVHANLFGGHYLSRVDHLARRYVG